ncbi:MAG: DUF2934 domain-containing protein [Rhodocyclaceae bacterium]|nr:MAG: DUF2934 domain-containing protein [Rhodocyclaceae bacterium]
MKSAATKSRSSAKGEANLIMQTEPASGGEDRSDHIATAAYYKAAARSFSPGRELDDWLEAEAEFLK